MTEDEAKLFVLLLMMVADDETLEKVIELVNNEEYR